MKRKNRYHFGLNTEPTDKQLDAIMKDVLQIAEEQTKKVESIIAAKFDEIFGRM